MNKNRTHIIREVCAYNWYLHVSRIDARSTVQCAVNARYVSSVLNLEILIGFLSAGHTCANIRVCKAAIIQRCENSNNSQQE